MRLVPGTLLVAVLCSVFPSPAHAQSCPNGGFIQQWGCNFYATTQCHPNNDGPPTWTMPGWQQTRRANISPSSTSYTTLPSSSVPNCNGSGAIPAGSPWPSISVRLEGTRIWVYYDAPNFYCKDTADWPPFYTCTNDISVSADRLDLYLNGSLQSQSWIYFDYGKWDTGIDVTPCTRYKASIGYVIQGGATRSAWSAEETFLTNDSCPPPDRGSCPAGGGGQGAGMGAGKPINVGSGDVATQVSLFSLQQPPLPLDFTLSYHSSVYTYSTVTIPEPLGRGWTHPFNQVMKPIPSTTRLLHYTADGREFEYTQSGSVWNASRPAELRGQVTSVSGEYHLTDLDGTVTAFDQVTGQWKSTTDRWNNPISGTYTSGNLTAITDSMGRQATLTYSGSLIQTITIPETPTSHVWSFSYTSGNLTSIRDPLHTSGDWRTLGYDGGNRLTSITDDAGQLLEGHTYDAVSGRGLTSFSGTGDQDFVQVEYDVPGPGQRRVTHRIDSTTNQVSIFNVGYQGGRWRPPGHRRFVRHLRRGERRHAVVLLHAGQLRPVGHRRKRERHEV